MSDLHVHTFGDPAGTPLLALHGITAHGRRFERLAVERWRDRYTIAPDLRGHGRSTPLPPWTIEQHVADVVGVLDDLSITDTDVVGHSFGGAVAVHLLARHADRIRRVVLLDPALELDPLRALDLARSTITFPGHATVDDAIAARNAGLGHDIHPAVLTEVAEHLMEVEGRYRFRFEPAAVVAACGEMCRPLPSVHSQRPVLLVGASGAPFVDDRVRRRADEVLGNVRHATLDCGHMVYWERFDETATLVSGFLRQRGVPGSPATSIA